MLGNPQASPQRGLRILIVEDEMLVAMDAEAILHAAGYEVVGIAASADAAVAKATELLPDLVLMDIRLNGPRDGIDAAADMAGPQGPQIIFVTANTDPATHARAMVLRPVAILAKPFTEETLLGAVERVWI
jgi:two-component system, response regulator PdtaR